MVNSSWCDSASIVPLTRSCTPNLELLTISCRPFYLPREFTSVIVNAVYIPPQADTDTALCELHEALIQHQTQNRNAVLIVAGDFNSANLKRTALNLYQHINCPTRGERTLDHCYTTVRDSYKAQSRPLAHLPCVGSLTTSPSSSCRNINKGSGRKFRLGGRSHTGQTNRWPLCRTLWMMQTGTCIAAVFAVV